MTQHLVFTGTGMAFQSIGFAAALILNRLRASAQITDDAAPRERNSRGGFLSRLKTSEVMMDSVDRYAGNEPAVLIPVISEATVVNGIERAPDSPQVYNTVVGAKAVDVVDFFSGPATMDMQPSEPVRHEVMAVNRNRDVAEAGFVTCDTAGRPTCGCPLLPSEEPGLLVIVEKFSQALGCGPILEFLSHSHSPRSERQIAEDDTADDSDREKHHREEQETRAQLKRVNERLNALNKKLRP